jgi:hypothetical protein
VKPDPRHGSLDERETQDRANDEYDRAKVQDPALPLLAHPLDFNLAIAQNGGNGTNCSKHGR